MLLKGNIVVLRPIETEDLEFMRNFINDPQIEACIVGWAFPLSRKDQQEWYAQFSNSAKALRYIIETQEGERVGLTGLRDIDWKNGSASSAGIRVIASHRGKGIAGDAYRTMLRYAFRELRLHRVSASALSINAASIRFMTKVGFRQEGVVRECTFKDGCYHDKIIFGCLASDYEEASATDTPPQ